MVWVNWKNGHLQFPNPPLTVPSLMLPVWQLTFQIDGVISIQPLSRKLQAWTGRFRSPLSLRIVSSIFLSLAVIEGIMLIPSVEKRQQEILSQNEEVSAGKFLLARSNGF